MPNEFALEQRAWVKRWKTGSERLREVTVEEVGPHPMPGTGANREDGIAAARKLRFG